MPSQLFRHLRSIIPLIVVIFFTFCLTFYIYHFDVLQIFLTLGTQQIIPVKPREVHRKSEPENTKANDGRPGNHTIPTKPVSKVEYTTEIFNMLSVEECKENDSKLSTANCRPTGGLQCMFFLLKV
jgi:hypothetical protein